MKIWIRLLGVIATVLEQEAGTEDKTELPVTTHQATSGPIAGIYPLSLSSHSPLPLAVPRGSWVSLKTVHCICHNHSHFFDSALL